MLRGAALTPRVIAYHEITPEASDYAYHVSRAQLETHLRLLTGWRRDGARQGLPVEITFDDGHVSNYEHALPLLQAYGCAATFFVTAGYIQTGPEFMTWEQLRELRALGHQVHSHGWSHLSLTRCSERQLEDELRRSREALEDRLGSRVDAISAPHGRWNRRALTAAARIGYTRFYVSHPWIRPSQRDGVRLIGRLMLRNDVDARRLESLLTAKGARLLARRGRYAVKEAAAALLGERLYFRLWLRLARWRGPDKFGAA